jgi:hypothetical protein
MAEEEHADGKNRRHGSEDGLRQQGFRNRFQKYGFSAQKMNIGPLLG